MKEAQGIVTAIMEQGKARVAIQTDDTLPGCSSRTEYCHHCSERTSSLVVNVTNRAGAGVGDNVSVLFESGAVLKSIIILIGIPLAGVLVGAILGNSLYESSRLSGEDAFLAGAGCFGFAVVFAFFAYRQFSADLQPYIDHVIAPGPASQGTVDPVCGMEVDSASAAAKVDYEGRTYFFCNAKCLEAFIREPSKYLVPANCPHLIRGPKAAFVPARE